MRKRGWFFLFVVVLLALCGAAQQPPTLIIVDADVQTLTLYEDQKLVKTWPCAVGKSGTPSPLGVWSVNGKAANWGTGFGSRYISINCPWGRFGIHGTNKPYSIGSHASHGCVRMLNKDVEELYPHVRVGAKVIIERDSYGDMAAGLRKLAPGSRGADVYQVQTRLANLGYYYGTPDGIYGEGMKDALLRYKRAVGLPATHFVDWQTYQKLGVMLFE